MAVIVHMALCAALCMACLGSCSWRGAVRVDNDSLSGFAQKAGQNRRVVVLSFRGDDANPQLASKVRESFYSHFSLKQYHDVELRDIDAMLDNINALSGKSWDALSPIELGRCFKADYLVYGRVLSTRRIFFVLYSQLAMDVEVRVVETRQGRTVWKAAIKKRMHSGEFPLHPLALVPAVMRTGIDAGDERMQDLIERTCRELADRVPDPQGQDGPGFAADIQVASFSSDERARQMAGWLQSKGYTTRIERVRINGTNWHRVLVGPYARSDAENARKELGADPAVRPVLIYAR